MNRLRVVSTVHITHVANRLNLPFHATQVEHGDLNWVLPGKFIAFAGPQGSRDSIEGYKMLTPDDFISYFKKRNVSLVVRLNKKYYDAK